MEHLKKIAVSLGLIGSFALGAAGDKDTLNPNITDDYRIQVKFVETDAKGIQYSDAIYFSPEEFQAITQTDLDAKKKERFDNWKKSVEEASSRVTEPENEEPI